jgi:hypothetical protein
MMLKVYYHEEPLLRGIVAKEPEAAKLRDAVRQQPEEVTRDERVRLGELVNTAIEQQRDHDAADILDQLEKVITRAGSEPPEKELMVLNAPLLVARDRLEDVEAVVEEVATERAERMHFKLLGPMPAYHFIDTEEPAPA